MNLFKIIKNSSLAVFKNPAMMLLFILFAIGANFLASYVMTAPTKTLAQILIICLFGFVCLFISGWFEVLKKSCDLEKIKETNYYHVFSAGISKNIVQCSIGFLLYVISIMAFVITAQVIASKLYGNINFFLNDLNTLPPNNINLVQYFDRLPDTQKTILYGWNACIMISILLFNFLSMFYFPSLTDEKNDRFKSFIRPFTSIWYNLKFLFTHFLGAVTIGVLIYFINLLMLILIRATIANAIASLIAMLAHIYFIVIVIMVIFNYYEQKNNCNNGANGIGQDRVIDSVSQND